MTYHCGAHEPVIEPPSMSPDIESSYAAKKECSKADSTKGNSHDPDQVGSILSLDAAGLGRVPFCNWDTSQFESVVIS